MRGTFKVQGEEKAFSGALSVDWDVAAMAQWIVTLPTPEEIEAFAAISVERDGDEIFGGITMIPKILYDAGGTVRPLSGYDYTVLLLNYLCPFQSLVDVDTETALTSILTNTPFLTSVEGTFGYLSDPTTFDTHLEFLDFDYDDTCIEFDTGVEVLDEIMDTVNALTLPTRPEYCGCFLDFGQDPPRFFVWWMEGGTLRYTSSTDFSTWAGATNTTLACTDFSLGWDGTNVCLFIEDGGGNTDVYRGTIAAGVVTLVLRLNNAFAGWITSGPVFDSQGDWWCIYNNIIYESSDTGATWNNRGTPGAGGTAVFIVPQSSDGDMCMIVYDAVNGDLEEWLYDRSLGTLTYQRDVDGTCNGCDYIRVVQNADYRKHLVYHDGTDLQYATAAENAAWSAKWDVTPAGAHRDQDWSLCADGGEYCYLTANFQPNGWYVRKMMNGDTGSWVTIGSTPYGGDERCDSPQTFLQDGQYSCFYTSEDNGDDIWGVLPDPEGIRLVGGATTGYFTTDTITASGAMIWWGWVIAAGTGLAGTSWDVLKAADDSELVTDQGPTFDMKIAGVPSTETSIKIRGYLIAGSYVSALDYSEYQDVLTMDTDITEDAYTGVQKLASLSAAEFWMTEEDGVYTLHISSRRGEDKSDYIVLRNGLSSRHPEVHPNLKIVSKESDWGSFANGIQVVGFGTAGVDRIEEAIQDWGSVGVYGEHWRPVMDQGLITEGMARTRAAVELETRNTVVIRVTGKILDVYEPGDIEIGDSVMVCADFEDVEEEELNEALRVVGLVRTFSSYGDEDVEVIMINAVKSSEYWQYLGQVPNLVRWIST